MPLDYRFFFLFFFFGLLSSGSIWDPLRGSTALWSTGYFPACEGPFTNTAAGGLGETSEITNALRRQILSHGRLVRHTSTDFTRPLISLSPALSWSVVANYPGALPTSLFLSLSLSKPICLSTNWLSHTTLFHRQSRAASKYRQHWIRQSTIFQSGGCRKRDTRLRRKGWIKNEDRIAFIPSVEYGISHQRCVRACPRMRNVRFT